MLFFGRIVYFFLNFSGGDPRELMESPRKVGDIGEAVFCGDLLDFEPGVEQVGSCRLEFPGGEVVLDALPCFFAEDAAEQRAADADVRRKFGERQGAGESFGQFGDGGFNGSAVAFAGGASGGERQIAMEYGEEFEQSRLSFEFGFRTDPGGSVEQLEEGLLVSGAVHKLLMRWKGFGIPHLFAARFRRNRMGMIRVRRFDEIEMEIVHSHRNPAVELEVISLAGTHKEYCAGADGDGFAAQLIAAGSLMEIVKRMIPKAGLLKDPHGFVDGEIMREPQPRRVRLRSIWRRSCDESLFVHWISPDSGRCNIIRIA